MKEPFQKKIKEIQILMLLAPMSDQKVHKFYQILNSYWNKKLIEIFLI
jgi:hypothetical protein